METFTGQTRLISDFKKKAVINGGNDVWLLNRRLLCLQLESKVQTLICSSILILLFLIGNLKNNGFIINFRINL